MTTRTKTTSAQYVASRARDPTFEKLMEKYKNLLKLVAIQDPILASSNPSSSILLDFLNRLSQKLHMNFFVICAVFKVWRELGLPDDFEDSVISQNSNLFGLCDGHEPNTHILKLVDVIQEKNNLKAAIENRQFNECCREDSHVVRTKFRFSFKHDFPPGMRLSKDLKATIKEWQRLPYVGPYEGISEKRKSKAAIMALEKRAVAIKISHFRKWFKIDMNIRDLFLDHARIFYVSNKGKTHAVFLREAYERGCLIDPNPVYEARRKLLNLVLLEHQAFFSGSPVIRDPDQSKVDEFQGKE
ncbi:hypothetical protein BT93_A2278 [Corymbia citriodora subsp. variegata]|nr:hypothetical protein BT93_A2278 [Corymbia citriodora subsp. variegata]